MRVWVIKDGENLPLQEGSRPMRSGLLCKALASRGCEVDWWTSTFSHQRKQRIAVAGQRTRVRDNYHLNFLECGTYRRNVSLARVRHHRRYGVLLEEALANAPRPDAIVCSFPIIEAAFRVTRWARQHAVPVLLDVRDYWPDLYVDRLPKAARPLGKTLLAREFAKARNAFRNADGFVGISPGILDWACDYASRERVAHDRVFYTGYPEPSVAASSTIPEFITNHPGPANRRIFTFVGMFNGSYRLDIVCRAAEQLAAAGEERALFVLAGDGQHLERLRQNSSHLPNILFPGWLDHQQIGQLLLASHVGLVPCHSKEDTMPNKLYEYWAHGLPVISSLQGEAEAWINRHQVGLNYSPDSADQLVAHVRRVLAQEPEQPGIKQRARDLYTKHFSEQGIYGAYADHVMALAQLAFQSSIQPPATPLRMAG